MQLWGFFCNNNATFNNAIYQYGGERGNTLKCLLSNYESS